MAKQVITLLTDDLDGGEADRTVEFGLDGVNYTIDLSEKNAGKLRKALDPYLNVATRVGRSGGEARSARRAATGRQPCTTDRAGAQNTDRAADVADVADERAEGRGASPR